MPASKRAEDWAMWLELTRCGIEPRKYPGCHVVYYKWSDSLSSQKLLKAIDMYQIYTAQEKIGLFRSGYLLARFAVNVMSRRL
jgi:hypothetical protein